LIVCSYYFCCFFLLFCFFCVSIFVSLVSFSACPFVLFGYSFFSFLCLPFIRVFLFFLIVPCLLFFPFGPPFYCRIFGLETQKGLFILSDNFIHLLSGFIIKDPSVKSFAEMSFEYVSSSNSPSSSSSSTSSSSKTTVVTRVNPDDIPDHLFSKFIWSELLSNDTPYLKIPYDEVTDRLTSILSEFSYDFVLSLPNAVCLLLSLVLSRSLSFVVSAVLSLSRFCFLFLRCFLDLFFL
jgi:hypothetical protein